MDLGFCIPALRHLGLIIKVSIEEHDSIIHLIRYTIARLETCTHFSDHVGHLLFKGRDHLSKGPG